MDNLMLAWIVLDARAERTARDERAVEEKDAWWTGRSEEML
ncbi:hypothetical protein [Mumia sp. Pv 4-285]